MAKNLSELVPDLKPERVATGFKFTEGPVWHPDGYLLFSDIPAAVIYQWRPGRGATPYVRHSRQSNGLTLDRQGRLMACEHEGRQVSRQASDGSMQSVVSQYNGKRFNSPNDIVVHSSGAIYFTDPPYGIQPEQQEQPYYGVYRINTDGSITLLVSDFVRPNGLAFSPDESVLYIDDTRRRKTWAFDLRRDGWLSNGRVFVDMNVPASGNPDGMKVDTEGNVYITGGGGIWVLTAEGRHLGTIPVPEQPANLAFGDADARTLYITAQTSVYKLRVNVPGVRPYG
ncbi:MAG: SMP-30/gluconolactonase/LRE family protein [SAR202 cluster bacterium]|nr:SMP-30/gluconolactonase/LRE family protein [SAR202 cluster bacterium]